MVYVVKRVTSKLRRIDCINCIMKSRKKNSEVVSPDISSVFSSRMAGSSQRRRVQLLHWRDSLVLTYHSITADSHSILLTNYTALYFSSFHYLCMLATFLHVYILTWRSDCPLCSHYGGVTQCSLGTVA